MTTYKNFRSKSASSLSIFSEVISEDFLSCKFCYRGLIKPKVLKCLHTFCLECLQPQVKKLSPSKSVIECSMCHASTSVPGKGLEGLPDNLLVTRLGSQFLDDATKGAMPCDSCENDEYVNQAQFRCLDCTDYLCEECQRAHRRTRLTRGHTIIELDSIKSILSRTESQALAQDGGSKNINSTPVNFKSFDLCALHQDQPATVYDFTCEEMLCAECNEIDEHHKHKREPLAKATTKIRKQIQVLCTELERLFPIINSAVDDIQLVLSQTSVDMKNLISDVHNHAEYLRTAISDKEAALIQQLQVIDKDNHTALQKNSNELMNSQAALVAAYQFSHQLTSHGEQTEVLLLRQFCMERLKQLQGIRVSDNIQTTQAHMQIPDNLEGLVDMISGRIVTTHKIVRPVLLSQLQVELDIHQEWFTAMALNHTTKDLVLAVASIKESKSRVIIFNAEQKRGGFHTNQLTGLCLTKEGNIVTMDKRECRVKMYTIHGQLIRSFKCLSTGGIAINQDGHIVVASSISVHTYRRNGELLNSFGDRSRGKRHELNVSKQIALNSTGDVTISDIYDSKVTVYNTLGHSKFTYKLDSSRYMEQDTFPEGICIDKSDNILIADRNNHRIHMISQNGAFRSFVVTADDGLYMPRFVTINQDGYLIVAEHNGLIKTFRYL